MKLYVPAEHYTSKPETHLCYEKQDTGELSKANIAKNPFQDCTQIYFTKMKITVLVVKISFEWKCVAGNTIIAGCS